MNYSQTVLERKVLQSKRDKLQLELDQVQYKLDKIALRGYLEVIGDTSPLKLNCGTTLYLKAFQQAGYSLQNVVDFWSMEMIDEMIRFCIEKGTLHEVICPECGYEIDLQELGRKCGYNCPDCDNFFYYSTFEIDLINVG